MTRKSRASARIVAVLASMCVVVLMIGIVASAQEDYAPYTAGPVVRELRYVPDNAAPPVEQERPYAPYTEDEVGPYAPYTAGPVVRELRYLPYTEAEPATQSEPVTEEPYAPYPLPR